MIKRLRSIVLAAAILPFCGQFLFADGISPEALPSVQRGVGFIKTKAKAGTNDLGKTALMAFALEKADVPASDPDLRKLTETVLSHFDNGTVYVPQQRGGIDMYEAAVVIMALGNFPGGNYRPQMESAANYIMNGRKTMDRGTILIANSATRRFPNTPSWDYGRPRSMASTFHPVSGIAPRNGIFQPKDLMAHGFTTLKNPSIRKPWR